MRKWSQEEAAGCFKEHNFKNSDYEKIANYHAFRQENPDKYDEFRADKAPFGFNEDDGVMVVYGIFTEEKERKSEIQTFKFYHGEGEEGQKSALIDRHDKLIERRFIPATEMRISTRTSGLSVLEGYASVFDVWSENLGFMGNFREKVKSGSFTKTIKNDDIRALWNHNPDFPLGRNTAGTLRLWEDKKGLGYEIDLPNTSYANDLRESVSRGDVSQNSFGFITIEDNWFTENKEQKRELLEVQLFDISPVTYPAYTQTSLNLRSYFISIGFTPEKANEAVERAVRGISPTEEDREQIKASILPPINPPDPERDDGPEKQNGEETRKRLFLLRNQGLKRRLELKQKQII